MRKFCPTVNFDIAKSRNNSGRILGLREKYDKALSYRYQALKIREKLFPLGHVDISFSYKNIGSILHRQGKH